MRKTIASIAVLLGWHAGLVSPAQAASLEQVKTSAPADITFGDVIGTDSRFLWRYLSTSDGKPLYTFDADGSIGKPTCFDECAKEFVPYLAPRDAKASGEWSIVPRGTGERQYAYKGQPLYSYVGRDPLPVNRFEGESFPIKSAVFDTEFLDPGSYFFSPKEGWRRAQFTPDEFNPTPSGIKLKSMAFANGYGLVSESSGLPLYVFDNAPKNPRLWNPVYAQDLAIPVGDFSIVVREDGRKQWAYKKRLLFSFKGDYADDDLGGIEQKDASPALVYQHFMPRGLQIKYFPLRGPLLITAEGKTLYTMGITARTRGDKRGEGQPSYGAGKVLGTKGCVDECLKTWSPFLASSRDRAQGFWEILEREDGTRQWAYRGSALYTYAGDKKPGDVEGNNLRTIVYGKADGSNYDLMTLAGGNRGPTVRIFAGAGFNWHVVRFNN